MRAAFLAFGEPPALIAPLMDALRARDVDVVASLDEPATIREQALRVGRADCDGVIFALGAGTVSVLVAEAALHVGCPILLVGEGQTEAETLLSALPILFDVLRPAETTTETVETWLRENGKSSRQKGGEVAAKLYGTRLITNTVNDEMQIRWLTQFGILISRPSPADPRETDIVVTEGAATDALTRRLLELVSASPDALPPDDSIFTAVQITEDSAGRFSAVIRLTQTPETNNENGFAVAGDFVGEMRAACHALGISAQILRDK